ncbi:MAG: helix-turn-helix domain-containing protein [Phycisphaeraceae bacterium]|jgi:predicted DNA-binding transcriptional regulator AlpA|nr:helix-turn-helix domain-containing protein [Phycisphaeraceae bacterium]
MLGISERLLWTLTNAGEVPHIRLGARVLYPVKALNEWIEERTSGSDR